MDKKLMPLLIGALLVLAIGIALLDKYANPRNRPSSTQTQNGEQAQNNGQPQQTTQDNYIKISEMGLKFKVPDDLKDLTYSIVRASTTAPNEPIAALFSSRAITDKANSLGDQEGKQYCVAEYGPLGAIVVLNRAPAAGGQSLPPNAKIVNDKYVFYEGPQATCTNNTEVQRIISSQIQKLQNAFPTLEGL